MHKKIKLILLFFYQLLSASDNKSQIELLCTSHFQQSGFLEEGSILVSGEKSQRVYSRVRFQVLENMLMLFYPMLPGVENCFLYDEKLSLLVQFNNVIGQVDDCLIQSYFDGRWHFNVLKVFRNAPFCKNIVFNAEQMFKLSTNRAVFISRYPEPTVYTLDASSFKPFEVEFITHENDLLFKIDDMFYKLHFDGREYKLLNNGKPLPIPINTLFESINLKNNIFLDVVGIDEYCMQIVRDVNILTGLEIPNSRRKTTAPRQVGTLLAKID